MIMIDNTANRKEEIIMENSYKNVRHQEIIQDEDIEILHKINNDVSVFKLTRNKTVNNKNKINNNQTIGIDIAKNENILKYMKDTSINSISCSTTINDYGDIKWFIWPIEKEAYYKLQEILLEHSPAFLFKDISRIYKNNEDFNNYKYVYSDSRFILDIDTLEPIVTPLEAIFMSDKYNLNKVLDFIKTSDYFINKGNLCKDSHGDFLTADILLDKDHFKEVICNDWFALPEILKDILPEDCFKEEDYER
jgi:hypothetical protein